MLDLSHLGEEDNGRILNVCESGRKNTRVPLIICIRLLKHEGKLKPGSFLVSLGGAVRFRKQICDLPVEC